MQNQAWSEMNAGHWHDRGVASADYDQSGPAQQDQPTANENMLLQSMPEIPLEKPYEEVLQ